MNKLVYFVDDDTVANQLFKRACNKLELECEVFDEARKCLEKIEHQRPDIILTDLNMPMMDGFEFIQILSQKWPALPVIAVTGQSSVERAVKAMQAGAADFIRKPYELDQLKNSIERNLEYATLTAPTSSESDKNYGMVGESPEILRVFRMIDKLGMVDCPVVISGDSGSGKELAARAIHYNGKRANEPFIAIDCGSLPDSLLESELFGHVKGAFTDATQDRQGLLEAAGQGSIFLDEIGNISNAMQTKLLRVFQEDEITPVGSNQSRPIHARLICASNRNLAEMVNSGEFRHDLYHRINVITLPMPALAERRQDIPLLINAFIDEFSKKYSLPYRYFSDDYLEKLSQLPWKGNVRELRNYVERSIILAEGDTLDDIPLPESDTRHCDESSGEFITLQELEHRHIKRVLKNVNGNQNKAAKILGISRTTLWRKINENN